jgi:hypothetical protein
MFIRIKLLSDRSRPCSNKYVRGELTGAATSLNKTQHASTVNGSSFSIHMIATIHAGRLIDRGQRDSSYIG